MRTTINRKRVIRPVVALPPSLTPPRHKMAETTSHRMGEGYR
jgi:hypothetical protein